MQKIIKRNHQNFTLFSAFFSNLFYQQNCISQMKERWWWTTTKCTNFNDFFLLNLWARLIKLSILIQFFVTTNFLRNTNNSKLLFGIKWIIILLFVLWRTSILWFYLSCSDCSLEFFFSVLKWIMEAYLVDLFAVHLVPCRIHHEICPLAIVHILRKKFLKISFYLKGFEGRFQVFS